MTSHGRVLRCLCLTVLLLLPIQARGDDLSASNWKAKVDPPAAAPAAPTSKDFAIPFPPNFGNGGEAVYPTTPSSFVVIGKNFFANDARQVWDLSTKKLVGSFKGQLNYDDKTVALSSDGVYLAGKPNGRNAVEVRTTKNGRVAQTFDLDSPFLDFIDFASNDRLVYGRVGDKKLQVADIKSGDPVCKVSLFEKADQEAIAMSPGRNYLALASWFDGTLRVYDLNDGSPVGEAPTPKKNRQNIRCFGLCFSPDGTELAGLFEYFGEYRIVCWSAADGKMVADFDLGKDIQRPNFYKDQGIGWLPDKSAWLVLGYAIVDRSSGKKVWDLPFDNDNLKPSARRFLDNDHAMVVTQKPAMALRTAVVPRDKIAGAAKIVREGGNAADAALPTLVKADLTGARPVDLRKSNPAWSVSPKASNAAETRLTARPVALKSKADDFRTVLFGSNGSTQAIAVGTPQQFGQPNPTDGQARWIERFDLASGKALGRVDLGTIVDPIALAPDGLSMIVREVKAKDRIDVMTTEGKPVAGWRPYDQESSDGKTVAWAAFLDQNRVLTVSGGGTLILWSLPKCKAVYLADDAFIGAPVLSPDRSLLAGFDGRGLRVVDTETGAWKGEGAMPTGLGQRPEVKSAAFRADGQEVAAVFKNGTLVRWDLKTGKVVSQFVLNSPNAGDALAWAGNKHVLLDNRQLVDLETKREVWEFVGGSVFRAAGGAGPDGRHWLVIRGVVGQETGRLASFDPIDPSLEKAEALLADENSKCSLRPGSKVSLQLNMNGPAQDAQGFRQAIVAAIGARLKKYGITLTGESAPTRDAGSTRVSYIPSMRTKAAPDARLVLNVRDKDTGQTIQYRRMGAGRGPVQVVKLIDLVCEFSLVDSFGGAIWTESRTIPMQPFGFVLRMPAGENDPEVYLKKLQWENVKKWAADANLPYFVAKDGNDVVKLPGLTDLNR